MRPLNADARAPLMPSRRLCFVPLPFNAPHHPSAPAVLITRTNNTFAYGTSAHDKLHLGLERQSNQRGTRTTFTSLCLLSSHAHHSANRAATDTQSAAAAHRLIIQFAIVGKVLQILLNGVNGLVDVVLLALVRYHGRRTAKVRGHRRVHMAAHESLHELANQLPAIGRNQARSIFDLNANTGNEKECFVLCVIRLRVNPI